VLGAVLASRTRAAIDAATACHGHGGTCVDARFMSDLLAGDVGHALAQLAPDLQRTLTPIAPAGFASGFASALSVAAFLALAIAAAIWLLAGRRSPDEVKQGAA
jgi:hypothetical protein